MAKRFPLEMADGSVARTLEDIREHFDEETLLGYYEDGMLLRWLEDRFYDEEVEGVRSINQEDVDFPHNLWQILGIPTKYWMSGADFGRLMEKENLLREKTNDESIIALASQTAFDQEDLADLLDKEMDTIYLCGNEFRIPLVDGINYEGILGTPKVVIKVANEDEAASHSIYFTNVKLPWGDSKWTGNKSKIDSPVVDESKWLVPKTQMQTMFKAAFKDEFESSNIENLDGPFVMIDEDKSVVTEWSDDQKKIALLIICENKYTEDELIHLRMSHDMTYGMAFTCDSFCILDTNGKTAIIPYEEYSPIGFNNLPQAVIKASSKNTVIKSFMGSLFNAYVFGLKYEQATNKFLQNVNTIFRKLKPYGSSSGSGGYGMDLV